MTDTSKTATSTQIQGNGDAVPCVAIEPEWGVADVVVALVLVVIFALAGLGFCLGGLHLLGEWFIAL